MVFECWYEGCGKICEARGGLTTHEKRMYKAVDVRIRFGCEKCGRN